MSLPANQSILDTDCGGMPDPAVREEIFNLTARMHKGIDDKVAPELDPPVRHIFSKGVYAREITIPEGCLVVGKIHKTSHINIISKGRVTVRTQFGMDEFSAPYTFISPIGTQRVVYAHEETIWTTIHPSDETDLEKLEAETIAKTYDEIPGIDGPEQPRKIKADRADFSSAVLELGFDEKTVREHSEIEDDMIDMPGCVHPYYLGESDIEGTGYFLNLGAEDGSVLAPARLKGMRTDAGRYVNHSATPNATIRRKGNSDLDLIAISNIGNGEEVTLDYRQACQENKL